MLQARCIITGCALIDNSVAYWGDLHRFSDVFIFVATCDKYGKPYPIDELPAADSKFLTVGVEVSPFVRGGIFVIPSRMCHLSPAAVMHVAEGEGR